MSDSNNKELYDFLNNYNLIQTDLSEDEIIESLDNIFKKLNENENFLTGFFVNEQENENPTVFFVSDKNRLISYPENENIPSEIDITEIDSVNTEGNKINLNIKDETYTLHAKDNEGAEVIEDALYSSFSELLNEEQIDRVFETEKFVDEDNIEANDKELEVSEVEEIEEEPQLPDVVQNDLIPVENEAPEQVVFTTSEAAALPAPEDASSVSEINFNEKGTGIVQNNRPEKRNFKIFGKEFSISRKAMLISGGIIIAVVACLLIYLATVFFQQHQKQEELSGIVAYYNEIDNYYQEAVELANKGTDGVTADQWGNIETEATDMETTLNDYEVNEDDDRLYQEVYFFNESIITAAYYGRNYVNTGNALFKSSLDTNLGIAKQYRLSVLSSIEKNYPDLIDKLDRPLTDEEAASVNPQEVIDKNNEMNSKPSEGALNRENSKSSNNFQENSESTRENR